MAITWGSGEGSGNLFYVGIDVSISGLTATVRLYVKSQYSVSDNQTLTWSNAASGTQAFRHAQSGGSAVLVKTLTVTGSNNQTKTIKADLSGAYNGATPTHSRSFTFPPPAILAPNTPASYTISFVSDSTFDHAWSNPAVADRPVDRFRVERYGYNNPGAGYVLQANPTSTPWRSTNGVYNTRYSYRVRAENSVGVSGWCYATVYTTPKAPSGVTLVRLENGSLSGTWTDLSPQNLEWEVQWQEGTGSWSASTILPDATTSATKTSPDPMVSHKMRIRSKAASRVSAWVESNTLTFLVKPKPPTSLSGGVFDPAREVTRSWVHNTVDGSGQQGSQTRYRLAGGTTWVEQAQVLTSAQTATWVAGFFTTGPGVEWQVRTKGAHADWSDWSATQVYTFATTPVVTVTAPSDVTWDSPVLRATWTSSQPQAQWRATLTTDGGATLETRSGSGSTLSTTFATRLLQAGAYALTVESRSAAGLWSDPSTQNFTASFPLPAKVSVQVTWDAANGWAVCSFTAAAPVGGESVPDQLDLYRSDNGDLGPWELVAQAVPVVVSITDTEPAVDGKAVWVARARNSTLGTEVDGPPATTEIPSECGYLSAGPGYENSLPLVYGSGSGPSVGLTVGKTKRSVVTLDGGTQPRRVLIETPELGQVVNYSGRIYGTTDRSVDTRNQLEAIAKLDGPHLYRDPDGRKIYGALSQPSIGRGDKAVWWDIEFSVEESDHDAIYGQVVLP